MPTKEEHRAKAVHNEQFVSSLATPYWDWAVTGLFYAAVHYVMAYLATRNIHPVLHQVRNSQIHRDAILNPLYIDYRELQNNSEDARYMERVPITAFSEQDAKQLMQKLDRIKAVVLPLL